MNKAQFQCNRCGNCCRWRGYVRLSDGEIDAIAAFLGLGENAFLAEYTTLMPDRRGLSLTENEQGHCIFFLDDPPRCRIQEVKPRQCRDFPEKWNFPGWEQECEGRKEPKQ